MFCKTSTVVFKNIHSFYQKHFYTSRWIVYLLQFVSFCAEYVRLFIMIKLRTAVTGLVSHLWKHVQTF